jgi:hypothetical protein
MKINMVESKLKLFLKIVMISLGMLSFLSCFIWFFAWKSVLGLILSIVWMEFWFKYKPLVEEKEFEAKL